MAPPKSEANIQAILSPEGGGPVGGCLLDPLHHPDIDQGGVQVVHMDDGQGLGSRQWWTHAARCTGWLHAALTG